MLDKKTKKVVVRMPPSPTGPMHIGTARTALFNYLFARQNGGQFLLRIEDTDKERSKKEYEDEIISGLKWLGLEYEGEMIRQSERTEVYKKYLKKLVDEDKAYISKETAKEPGDRTEVIRFRNPAKKITFNDLIRGEISFDTAELKDFIIAKSLDEPLYHLAVVIDDHEMNITHVIRGEDHISNTPRQILIQEAIGAPRPIYAHLPLILAPDRSKLSKRKHGESVSLSYYRNQGYLPEAMNNFMALLGWNPGNEREVFSLSELVDVFDISKVQKGGAVFSIEKLNWLNKQYLLTLPAETIQKEIAQKLLPEKIDEATLKRLVPTVIERIQVFSDITSMKAAGEFDYLFASPTYRAEELVWKKEPDREEARKHIAEIKKQINTLVEPLTAESVKAAIWPYAEEVGRGGVLWPFRYALSGKDKSPDPFTLAAILGKTKTLERLGKAETILDGGQDGLIGVIVLIIVVLIVLGYYGYNVRTIINSPNVQANLQYTWGAVQELWQEFSQIVTILYKNLIGLFSDLSQGLKNTKPY